MLPSSMSLPFEGVLFQSYLTKYYCAYTLLPLRKSDQRGLEVTDWDTRGQQCWHTVSMLRLSCDPQNKPALLQSWPVDQAGRMPRVKRTGKKIS